MFTSCTPTKQIESNKNTENNTFLFVLLSVSKDSSSTKNNVVLLNKTQNPGKLKSKNNITSHSENYLTINVFNENILIDSMTIEHPLYKHIEYLDENNSFAVKDTLINNAEFFLRLQTKGTKNEIRIFETLKNKQREKLTIIKL